MPHKKPRGKIKDASAIRRLYQIEGTGVGVWHDRYLLLRGINGILPSMDHLTYLGLGTNLGDRLNNLESARRSLPPMVHLTEASPIYQTAPWGYLDQPDFLNQVISCRTDLSPQQLLVYLKTLERTIGRRPNFRYGPRQIDIDILLFDDIVYQEDGLQIPHPAMHERAFVLVPLCDLAPDLLHPVLKKPFRELLSILDSQGVERYYPSAHG